MTSSMLPKPELVDPQARNRTAPLWVFDSESWDPTEAEFHRLVDTFCSSACAARIRKFRQIADRKRALVSSLLQRKACIEITGVEPDTVVIARTKGGKPYCELPGGHCKRGTPNFNFNASHDGSYVGICVHTHYLCGLDVHQLEADPAKVEFLERVLLKIKRLYAQEKFLPVSDCCRRQPSLRPMPYGEGF